MPKQLKKISAKGKYLPYPGVTVVAKVQPHPFWQALYTELGCYGLVTEHYTPLPLSSYHMTAINLMTQNSAPNGDLKASLEKNSELYQKLSIALAQAGLDLKPEIVGALATSNSLKLVLKLPESQSRLITEIAERFGFKEKIPNLFHITLGYAYKKVGLIDLAIINFGMRQCLAKLTKEYNSTVKLHPPKLSFFNDMQAYYDWDGKDFGLASATPSSSVLSSLSMFAENKAEKLKPKEALATDEEQSEAAAASKL